MGVLVGAKGGETPEPVLANENSSCHEGIPMGTVVEEELTCVAWHARRRSAILARHPEIEKLLHPNPWRGVRTVDCCESI